MRIGPDTVLDLQARCLGKLSIRRNADADDHQINVDMAPVAQIGAGDAALACQALQANAFADADAVALVQIAEVIRGDRRGDALKDAVGHLDQRDLKAALGRNSRRLKADIAATDDKHLSARL